MDYYKAFAAEVLSVYIHQIEGPLWHCSAAGPFQTSGSPVVGNVVVELFSEIFRKKNKIDHIFWTHLTFGSAVITQL